MTDTPDHKARGHSELGASICSRWWNCPGSVALTRGRPNRESEHARRGTAAHELAEICLHDGSQNAADAIGLTIHGIEITADLAEAVQVYVDDCRDLMTEDGVQHWIEVQFDLSILRPPSPMFGTADFVAYNPATGRLYVKDYKNGFLHVDEGTPQLRYYAVGAIIHLGPGTNVRDVEVTVVQPNGRAGAVRSQVYTVKELAEWSADLMRHARATQEPDAPLKAGSWCKFCPAAGVCPAQMSAALEVAQLEFGDLVACDATELVLQPLQLISIEDLAAIKSRGARLRAWLDAVDDAIEAELKDGRPVPGFKLVAGDAHRKWEDADKAADALEARFDIEPYEEKLITPAKAEAALAELLPGKTKKARTEAAKAALASLIVKPPGSPKVVPDADPRPALPAPGTEFDALPAAT